MEQQANAAPRPTGSPAAGISLMAFGGALAVCLIAAAVFQVGVYFDLTPLIIIYLGVRVRAGSRPAVKWGLASSSFYLIGALIAEAALLTGFPGYVTFAGRALRGSEPVWAGLFFLLVAAWNALNLGLLLRALRVSRTAETGKERPFLWIAAPGAILLALLGLASFARLVQRRRVPVHARPAAVQERYAAQLGRLRMLAGDRDKRSGMDGTTNHPVNLALFVRDEIIEASIRTTHNCWKTLYENPQFDDRGSSRLFPSSPGPGRPVVNVSHHTLADGGTMDVATYEEIVVDDSGRRIGVVLALDLGKLTEAAAPP
jgi:hypothetical protein